MISRKLFGPPGTGKTTKLLKYVKTFLKLGTPIDKIGYFAFTTKAANEAVDRMLDYHTAFHAPSNGEVSNHPGDALVVGLLLICLFAAALLTPFERLIPQERDGNRSSPSTSTDSLKKRKPGGTEKG